MKNNKLSQSELLNVLRCCHCGLVKPLGQFSKDATRWTGYQSLCKSCNLGYIRKRRGTIPMEDKLKEQESSIREIKETDLAYMAGLFDGEGCIRISKSRKKGYPPSYSLQLQLTITDKWACELFRFHFGGHICAGDSNKRNPKYKPSWQWSLGSGFAVNMLESLLPYLVLKKPQAELAIKFHTTKGILHNRLEKSQYNVQREVDYIAMKYLKTQSIT